MALRKYYTTLIPFYTFFLLYMMLFGCGRMSGEVGNLQLTPFRSIHYFTAPSVPFSKFFLNVVCNIVVFVPFGWMGLSFRKMQSFFLLLPLFVVAIIGVELTQHFSGRGTADVDDVILNTLGMSTGYFFLSAFRKRIEFPQMQPKEI